MATRIKSEHYWTTPALSQSYLKNIEFPQTEKDNYETTKRYFEEGNFVDAIVTKQVQDKYIVLENVPKTQKALEVCEDIARAHIDADLLDEDFIDLDVVMAIFDMKNYYAAMSDPQAKWDKISKYLPYIKSTILRLRTGLKTISSSEMDSINNCVRQFHSNEIISSLERDEYDFEYQLGILFDYKGVESKALLDIVAIHHATKTIVPIDIKTTREKGYNFPKAVKRLRYDIQAIWYTEALSQLYPDYTIMPFLFIVLSKDLNESQSYTYSFDTKGEGTVETKDYIDQLLSYHLYRQDNPEKAEEHILQAMYDVIPLNNLLW